MEQPPRDNSQIKCTVEATPLLDWSKQIKAEDREQLAKLSPIDAQLIAQSVLDPKLATVKNEGELAWPGDLADDWEPDVD
ncbi:MAG: hypothetical protein ABL921_23000 [Pirellula sp.]